MYSFMKLLYHVYKFLKIQRFLKEVHDIMNEVKNNDNVRKFK